MTARPVDRSRNRLALQNPSRLSIAGIVTIRNRSTPRSRSAAAPCIQVARTQAPCGCGGAGASPRSPIPRRTAARRAASRPGSRIGAMAESLARMSSIDSQDEVTMHRPDSGRPSSTCRCTGHRLDGRHHLVAQEIDPRVNHGRCDARCRPAAGTSWNVRTSPDPFDSGRRPGGAAGHPSLLLRAAGSAMARAAGRVPTVSAPDGWSAPRSTGDAAVERPSVFGRSSPESVITEGEMSLPAKTHCRADPTSNARVH